ncbi:MAG: xanthine dehydrogenase family protein molybdopterin-binding subunit [Hyphomicrobiaceae bacterium]
MNIQADRRAFLKGGAALAAALIVGIRPDGSFAAGNATAAEINPFVRIMPDGIVQVVLKHFEMGQGTTTGLTTLVAEELDADWDRVDIEFAPADNKRYKNLYFGVQGTGGSTAMPNSFMQYRKAGAAAREVLVAAAAAAWGVPAASITIEKGMLKSGSRTAHFGEMIEKARTLTPSKDPALKDPSQFRLIGKDGLQRKDVSGKTDGTAVFAMDVKVPGMVYAMVLHAPRFGGTLKSFDAADAKAVPGFIDAKASPLKNGVIVYGKNTWAAMQARDAITAEWDYSKAENRSTKELQAYHRGLLSKPEFEARKGGNQAEAETAIKGADEVVEAELYFPTLAHAPMEPLNCVIEPTENGVRIHDGCQFPGGVQPALAKVLKKELENVEVKTVYAGGSFGRRATPGMEYQVEAAFAFALLGGQTPVKLVRSREDDIRGGYYRPMAMHKARIGVKDGRIIGWDHRIACKPIIKGTMFESKEIKESGVDPVSVEGVNDTHYALPDMSVGLSDAATPMPVLWWRSVGHTHTAYAMETMMDMAAIAAKQDPVAFRLSYLPGSDKDQKRLAGVLKLAAEKAGWGKAGAGRYQGVAVHKSFKSYVAQVVEVSLRSGKVKIEKVTCAVDCGIAVNPDVIRAQMEGGIGFGLGAVMRNEVTLTNGEVDQFNFTDYEPIRMSDMPQIDVHIVKSAEPPTGVGEPGVPPAGPALANAIFAATGKRITRLPMTASGVEFA